MSERMCSDQSCWRIRGLGGGPHPWHDVRAEQQEALRGNPPPAPPPDIAVRLTARSAAHAIQDDMLTNSKGHADTLEIIQRHIEARDRSHTDELREAGELLRNALATLDTAYGFTSGVWAGHELESRAEKTAHGVLVKINEMRIRLARYDERTRKAGTGDWKPVADEIAKMPPGLRATFLEANFGIKPRRRTPR